MGTGLYTEIDSSSDYPNLMKRRNDRTPARSRGSDGSSICLIFSVEPPSQAAFVKRLTPRESQMLRQKRASEIRSLRVEGGQQREGTPRPGVCVTPANQAPAREPQRRQQAVFGMASTSKWGIAKVLETWMQDEIWVQASRSASSGIAPRRVAGMTHERRQIARSSHRPSPPAPAQCLGRQPRRP
jgi:hypothetical protein